MPADGVPEKAFGRKSAPDAIFGDGYAAGFIGSNTVDELMRRGHNVVDAEAIFPLRQRSQYRGRAR